MNFCRGAKIENIEALLSIDSYLGTYPESWKKTASFKFNWKFVRMTLLIFWKIHVYIDSNLRKKSKLSLRMSYWLLAFGDQMAPVIGFYHKGRGRRISDAFTECTHWDHDESTTLTNRPLAEKIPIFILINMIAIKFRYKKQAKLLLVFGVLCTSSMKKS